MGPRPPEESHAAGPASVLLNDGSGGFATKAEFALGIFPYGSPVVGDFDGDGTTDFAIPGLTTQYDNASNALVVFLNNGCTPPGG